jgi:hypothetical protein
MYIVKTFILNSNFITVNLSKENMSNFMGVEIPIINIMNGINIFKIMNNECLIYIKIILDTVDTGHFNATILDKNKEIISPEFSISPFNSNIYHIDLFNDDITDARTNDYSDEHFDESQEHHFNDDQDILESQTILSQSSKNSKSKTQLIMEAIKVPLDMNQRIEQLKKNKLNSYASVAKQAVSEEVEIVSKETKSPSKEKEPEKKVSLSIQHLHKYDRLETVFKTFIEDVVEKGQSDTFDFKQYLNKINCSDFIPLLEYNQEVIDFYENIKENHSHSSFPTETFFERASTFLRKEHPEFGVVFGEFSSKGFEYRKFIVYHIESRRSKSYPKLAREPEFYMSEKNRVAKIISSYINNLKDGFEPFEFKDIPEVCSMCDLFFSYDVKTAIMSKLSTDIRNMIFINFRTEYPGTPEVMYNNHYVNN